MGDVIQFQSKGQRARLREAQQQHELVRLWRGDLEHGSFCGYVAGVGREFFALRVIGDGLSDDGLYVMRHRDITELEAPEKHQDFVEKALALKNIHPQLPDSFPLDEITQMVKAAARLAPVMAVHVDSEDESEVCYIGRLINIEDDGFNLQEITPDAEWLREPSFFGWDEVSTLSIEEPYAQALLAVAGDAPTLETGDSGVGRAP